MFSKRFKYSDQQTNRVSVSHREAPVWFEVQLIYDSFNDEEKFISQEVHVMGFQNKTT